MKHRELRNMLADSIQLEQELYDFALECLRRIYGDKADQAIAKFDEGIEYRHDCGCIQGLFCIDAQLKNDAEARAAYNASQLKEAKDV